MHFCFATNIRKFPKPISVQQLLISEHIGIKLDFSNLHNFLAMFEVVFFFCITNGVNIERYEDDYLCCSFPLEKVIFRRNLLNLTLIIAGVMVINGYLLPEDVYTWTAIFILPVNSAINPILCIIAVIKQKVSSISRLQTTCTVSKKIIIQSNLL